MKYFLNLRLKFDNYDTDKSYIKDLNNKVILLYIKVYVYYILGYMFYI